MLEPQVADYLDANRQHQLQKLLELIRIPSIANIAGPDDPCAQAAQWLDEHLRNLGMASQVVPTEGKPIVLAHKQVDPSLPTLLVYGHYDVQPAEPLELWETPPFEPSVRHGRIYARGANDDKGQLWTHLMAVEAYVRTVGLPLNVKVVLEGEEEVGSPHMERFLEAYKAQLACDAIVISDSEFFDKRMPSITYGLRGVGYAEIVFRGPEVDLHSGLYGGVVTNPINALARLVASLHDDSGRVTLPGFYDGVQEVTEQERKLWKRLPVSEKQVAHSLGLGELGGGEKGLDMLTRQWARPTIDCNGIIGGYTGSGRKTVLPAEARTKLSFRLVGKQDSRKIYQSLAKFVADNTPPGIRSEVTGAGEAWAVTLPLDCPQIKAAGEALEEAFGHEAVFIRCGATVPITEMFQRILGVNPVMMGFGLPDDRLHSPNEKFDLDQLYNGSRASASFMARLAKLA